MSPDLSVYRIEVPDDRGGCEPRTIALGQGSIAPVDSTLVFDLSFELTLEDNVVTGVTGRAGTGDYTFTEESAAWWEEVAESVDRVADGPFAGDLRWALDGDRIELVLGRTEPWQTPVRVASGTYQLR